MGQGGPGRGKRDEGEREYRGGKGLRGEGRGVFRGLEPAPLPFDVNFFGLIFNVKKIMLNFEHIFEMYT